MKIIGVATLGCFGLLAGLVFWAALNNNPMGGEPFVVVKIAPQPVGTNDLTNTADGSAGDQQMQMATMRDRLSMIPGVTGSAIEQQ